MGVQSIKTRLAPELCYEAVTKAVREYLKKSGAAGRYQPYYEHLVVPILRAGYHPPGLLDVKDFISRLEVTARAAAKYAAEGEEILSVDEGALIEAIMGRYPTARLRARRLREANERFDKSQAEQWRRENTAKCNTLQQNSGICAVPREDAQ